jgi:hypothetical protein
MPYIKGFKRFRYDKSLSDLVLKMNDDASEDGELKAGVLNYLVSTLCKHFILINGKNYENLNAVCGVLDCAKEEFRRRMINAYEDAKILENGDIY